MSKLYLVITIAVCLLCCSVPVLAKQEMNNKPPTWNIYSERTQFKPYGKYTSPPKLVIPKNSLEIRRSLMFLRKPGQERTIGIIQLKKDNDVQLNPRIKIGLSKIIYDRVPKLSNVTKQQIDFNWGPPERSANDSYSYRFRSYFNQKNIEVFLDMKFSTNMLKEYRFRRDSYVFNWQKVN